MCEWCERYLGGDEDERERLVAEFWAQQPRHPNLGDVLKWLNMGEYARWRDPAIPESMSEQAHELAGLPVATPEHLRERLVALSEQAYELNKRAARRAAQGHEDVADAMDACADARYLDAEAIYAELRP